MKSICLSIVFSFTLVLNLAAQSNRKCATDEYQNQLLHKNYEQKLQGEKLDIQPTPSGNNNSSLRIQQVIDIPVVFHVVYKIGAQNIPAAQILEQMNVINDDYSHMNADTINTPLAFAPCAANTGIHFCLAQQDPNGQPTTGIVYVQTTANSFSLNDAVKYTAQGGHDAWPNTEYLNVWVCNLANGFLGYSTFPGAANNVDGVVIHYGCIGGPNLPGASAPFNIGRTLTHNIAHWLNVMHFTNNCDTLNTSPCAPPQMSLPNGCPSFPNISCNNGPNGEMFMNFIQTVDDNCMNIFNQNQAAIMNATLNTSRSSLLTSAGCIPVGILETNDNSSYEILPNPFTTEIKIKTNLSQQSEFILYDITGRNIMQQKFVNNISIDTKLIANGVYTLEILTNGNRFTKKIVKQ